MAAATQPTRPSATSDRRRIVLTTLGSLGDLHPFIAIGLGLKARGHEVVLATGECYRHKVEALGLGFRPLRPDSDFVTDPEVMRRGMDPRWGSVWIIRELVLPALRNSYEDTLTAAEGADLLVSHPLTYATRLVAEKTGIPWASTVVTPVVLGSALDPPLLPGLPDLAKRLLFLGPAFWVPLRRLLTWATRVWAKPLYRFRAEIGLPPAAANPLVDGHSPTLVLTLFSGVLAAKQPDWPPQTVVTGFPFYDQDGGTGPPPELVRFLADGPPPIVFTLGRSAATVAGHFYETSIAVAKRLRRRAVLVAGKNVRDRPSNLPDEMIVCDYAPFSELFHRAAVIVHPGGIGTTGLAMRSGRPMLVVPFAHDQPDNAERLRRLGIARTIYPQHYTPARAVKELRHLLDNPAYTQRASEVGKRIGAEDGVRTACEALEGLLGKEFQRTSL